MDRAMVDGLQKAILLLLDLGVENADYPIIASTEE